MKKVITTTRTYDDAGRLLTEEVIEEDIDPNLPWRVSTSGNTVTFRNINKTDPPDMGVLAKVS